MRTPKKVSDMRCWVRALLAKMTAVRVLSSIAEVEGEGEGGVVGWME